ncbi:related to feruloyl esterase B precursor (subclass of the carboxylic acid esterases) [Rhynchosporium secalis]|uniref:Related to feruloyl esterase B (Subclass of the carboxylic acid esterases) n=1 Tax=Rhynchosporium secalis TaxID=38038 RepID=A0A1E1MV52_RHYSE|nr:related to feruloyl esterase B precursor (subclass of the carboxylic acid esterases) [Rhynchosporium secalis]
MHLLSLSTAVVALASFAAGAKNQLQNETDFDAGPTAAKMHTYIPSNKLALAPIIVAIHYCTGTGPIYFNETKYADYADERGFIVLYPSSPSSGGCWDVASITSLTHDKGGDSKTIVNMVAYTIKKYGGDADRVYVTGSSSGAMMSNVLAGAYPNIFKAISAYSGVPDGCFFVPGAEAGQPVPTWNSDCSSGISIKNAQQWGDLTRSFYPGYNGTYPKIMIWHGTVDVAVRYPNFAETMKQWSNVKNLTLTEIVDNTPEKNYTKYVYGDGSQLVGYSGFGVGHTVPVHESADLAWFGLE